MIYKYSGKYHVNDEGYGRNGRNERNDVINGNGRYDERNDRNAWKNSNEKSKKMILL